MPVEVAATTGVRFQEPNSGDAHPGPRPQLADYRDERQTVTLGAGEKVDVTLRCAFEPQLVQKRRRLALDLEEIAVLPARAQLCDRPLTQHAAFVQDQHLIAHALEEYPYRLRFRARAAYVGPKD